MKKYKYTFYLDDFNNPIAEFETDIQLAPNNVRLIRIILSTEHNALFDRILFSLKFPNISSAHIV